jgi:anti-sigma regulatory factor (Ser/Thr protein kinase)
MFVSQIAMSAEPGKTEFLLEEDPRLLHAIRAIVSFSGERSGLSERVLEGFIAAILNACQETFPLVHDHAGSSRAIRVIVEDHPDRIEVSIEHSGEVLPTAGLDTFCAGAGDQPAGISGSLQGAYVDRVQYETHDGRARMRLIKYCSGNKAKV